MSDYELYHHGVKGMKWGVRKKPSGDAILRVQKSFYNAKKKRHEKRLNYHQNRLDKGYRESVLNPFYIRRLGKVKAHTEALSKVSEKIDIIEEARRILSSQNCDFGPAITSKACVLGEVWLTKKVDQMNKKNKKGKKKK